MDRRPVWTGGQCGQENETMQHGLEASFIIIISALRTSNRKHSKLAYLQVGQLDNPLRGGIGNHHGLERGGHHDRLSSCYLERQGQAD